MNKKGSKRNSKINPLNTPDSEAVGVCSGETTVGLVEAITKIGIEEEDEEEVIKRPTTIRIAKKRRKTSEIQVARETTPETSDELAPSSSKRSSCEHVSLAEPVEFIDEKRAISIQQLHDADQDTDHEEDFEVAQSVRLDQDNGQNDSEHKLAVTVAAADKSEPNEFTASQVENIYKLYKIILEQTDPVVWDNQEETTAQLSGGDEPQVLSFTDSEPESPSGEVKVTITSQIPFNIHNNVAAADNDDIDQAASARKHNRVLSSSASQAANLTICQSEFWSNTNEMASKADEDLIKLDESDQQVLPG